MVIPAAEISGHWNVALQNQERDVGEELDKAIDPFDEAPDVCVSEEEDAAALKESKEQAAYNNRKDNGTLEQAMRCAQSLEDTEGLEEEVMFNDHLSGGGGGFKSSAFSGYKGSSVEHRRNGFHLRPQAGFLMGALGTVEEERSASCSPRGDVSSHCSRGCCALPWNSFTVRGTLIGPEYVEEDQFPAKSRPSGSDRCFSRSTGSVSTSAVQNMLLSVLKQKSSLSSDSSSLSGILQDVIAGEIGEHTTQAIQALQKQA